jgi:hypothetical protein
MTAETIVIARLSVSDEFGVTWKMACGLKERPNAAIPKIIGMRLLSFSAMLL